MKIKDSLTKLSSSNKSVAFLCIPSHSGISGNERAYKCSHTATAQTEGIMSYPSSIRITVANGTVTGHISKPNWTQEKGSPNSLPPDIKQRDGVIFRRLKMGHTKLPNQHLSTKHPHPICEFSVLAIKHILIDSLELVYDRHQPFGDSTLREILDEKPLRASAWRSSCWIQGWTTKFGV